MSGATLILTACSEFSQSKAVWTDLCSAVPVWLELPEIWWTSVQCTEVHEVEFASLQSESPAHRHPTETEYFALHLTLRRTKIIMDRLSRRTEARLCGELTV